MQNIYIVFTLAIGLISTSCSSEASHDNKKEKVTK